MHENREISRTSCSKEQDRSAKAINRTADMHVQEKSDCAVVPANLSNKEAQASAEAGEGRAQTKENIVQSHKLPTQSGKGLSQGLRGVRQAARERKQERFTALLHHLNIGLLRDSFYALKRQASPGIDGVTWQEYETGLEDRLTDLLSRVHRGVYRAQPSRRVYIPKADGRQRPLGVAALEDKIVQQAVVTILNQIYEVDFKGFSYGFRPGRSPHQALDALAVGIQWKRVNWVLDADIRGFFDHMSHEWTMKFIEHRVADRRWIATSHNSVSGSEGRSSEGFLPHCRESVQQIIQPIGAKRRGVLTSSLRTLPSNGSMLIDHCCLMYNATVWNFTSRGTRRLRGRAPSPQDQYGDRLLL
jgi:RNA-directed DNA polymerase